MRVVIAPDKFKGSASARAAAAAMLTGLRAAWGDAFDARIIPLADGGEGTVAAFLANGARMVRTPVVDALGRPIEAEYALDGSTAIIEMSAASGLGVLAGATAPRVANTYGTGLLIRDALAHGATRIVLGIGGSATTDGGAGALVALGLRLCDEGGEELAPMPVALTDVAAVDASRLDARLRSATIEIACDVDNPLTGATGAAAVYGPQKGAAPADVAFLDDVLRRFADVSSAHTGSDLRAQPGAGAAGGLGWGLATFAGARLVRGFDVIAHLMRFPEALRSARVCFTGEGRIDEQSLRGKVVGGVAALAAESGVEVVAIAGSVDPAAAAALRLQGVTCIALTADPSERERAMREAPELIRAAAERWARDRQVRT